ncbi:hypothetical protein Tco_0458132 [Tanacetum coccineum]
MNVTSPSSSLEQTNFVLEDWGTNPSDSSIEFSFRTCSVVMEANGSGCGCGLELMFPRFPFSSCPTSGSSNWDSSRCLGWIVMALIELRMWVEHYGFSVGFSMMLLEHQDIIAEFYSPSMWKKLSKESGSVGLDPQTEVRGMSIRFAPTGWCQIEEVKVFFHLLDNPSLHAGANEKSLLDALTGPSNVLPDLALFGSVYYLPDGGAVNGNTVLNELLSKSIRTSVYENDKVQVKAEQGFEAMTGVKLSYVSHACGKHHFLVGSGTQHINMAQVFGVISKIQGYMSYPNDVPQFNPTQLPFNESSGGSSAYYQRRAKELQVNLSKKVTSLEREKVGLRRDLEWVMQKAILRMLAKFLPSEQFDNEMLKVQKVFIDRRCDLGHQEARDLLMSNQ